MPRRIGRKQYYIRYYDSPFRVNLKPDIARMDLKEDEVRLKLNISFMMEKSFILSDFLSIVI